MVRLGGIVTMLAASAIGSWIVAIGLKLSFWRLTHDLELIDIIN